MTRRKTHKQYLEEVLKQWGNEYSVLEEYKSQKIKILVRHNKCSREYYTYPDNLIRGHGCAECFKKNKLNKDKRIDSNKIINYIKESKNNEFELLEHYYKNGEARVKVRHLVCNNISDMVYQNFKNSCGCSYCSEIQRRKTRTKTTEQFQKEINSIFNEEYSVLGIYKGVKEKIELRHDVCNTVFSVTPTYALRPRETSLCPVCGKNERAKEKSISNKEFLEKVMELWDNEYTPLEKYKRNYIKIKVRHNVCGYEYKVVPSSLLSGNGCPKCCNFDSKACKKIEKFLQAHNFDYVREFKIKECKYKYPLPFDFAILLKDKIKLLIEYDGEQHYKSINHFGGEENFQLRRKRDGIKNEYCNKNNIKLLRINYMQDNEIEEILKRELL
ncbi:hypothetical protein FDF50_08260 [Clostridium botulinum]|uniref:Uncharacterized protein n=1 Tax=Clostridium botulinum TaxID=1491 RepID=A0A6G4HPU9_CLOBO|nr:hypothetical protein [Clostridium botulinum]MBO0571862.1 hypothetical protein [Clostridium botulinum]NFJ61672.1 hypothetical protein [Clostridium botulinum]NFQ62477.1 hypothetical protein [Clostridium botulinum]NFR17699.1 hypothetical protein [Clostridium botulinum]NFU16780.1 hypothetical protein [Clostridium botulinum]